MGKTVREILDSQSMESLRILCDKQGLTRRRSAEDLKTGLICSFRGSLSKLVHQLRKKDLIDIVHFFNDDSDVDFPTNFHRKSVAELRKICFDALGGKQDKFEAITSGDLDIQESAEQDENFINAVLHARVSNRASPPAVRTFSETSLAEIASRSSRVAIVSAYYATNVVKKIAGACHGKIQIVLNGLGGTRLAKQRDELRELQEELRQTARQADIRLAFADGIFHTKMYIFRKGRNFEAWIGSANVSAAALSGSNEEVLIKVSPVPQSVTTYFESVWKRGVSVNKIEEAVNSLVAFFRNGRLYYKPYAVLLWTINPFSKGLKRMERHDKEKLLAFNSEYADPEKGIGAFNIKRAYQRDESTQNTNQSLRRKALETCYGYWVADKCLSGVDDMLERASEKKRLYLEDLRDWLDGNSHLVIERYQLYLDEARKTMEEQKVPWWDYFDEELFKNTDVLENRLNSLDSKLRKPATLNKHCQAFIDTEVPEIWDDKESSDSFIESFFDSLFNSWHAPKNPDRDSSAALIIDALWDSELIESWDEIEEPSDLQRELEKALANEFWFEQHFKDLD